MVVYPNLLINIIPSYPHHIWAADFTELLWQGRLVYVATVIDLYTREIVGLGGITPERCCPHHSNALERAP